MLVAEIIDVETFFFFDLRLRLLVFLFRDAHFLRYNICEIVKRYIKICVLAGNILRTERTANYQRNDHN